MSGPQSRSRRSLVASWSLVALRPSMPVPIIAPNPPAPTSTTSSAPIPPRLGISAGRLGKIGWTCSSFDAVADRSRCCRGAGLRQTVSNMDDSDNDSDNDNDRRQQRQ
ncbi:hypothetical protein PMIN07_000317 [Paraphaeosphaeria minitans]|uniref:Uncharacterized protein n=1 Tax=Paraphaeosphaeria minitans TaxID=565426 RepID=A0A9P6KU31_9PLEO|nr:hypothetical protein PMIN01_02142 [Paraphaeosphaeria minitans]